MEMTDVYWLLISYYLNLTASRASIHFTCKDMGGVAGRGGKKDGKVCVCVWEGGRFESIKETEGRVR